MFDEIFLISCGTLSEIAVIICPEIMQLNIFPFYGIENKDILGTVRASHPHFPLFLNPPSRYSDHKSGKSLVQKKACWTPF